MDEDLWYDVYGDGEDDDEFFDEYEEDEGQLVWDQSDDGVQSMTAQEVFSMCVLPSTSDILLPLAKVFLSSCLLRFLSASGLFPSVAVSGASVVFGTWLAYQFFRVHVLYLMAFCVFIYPILFWARRSVICGSGHMVALATAIYVVICELVIVNETDWHTMRGAQMILSMKVISLAFDLDNGHILRRPGFLDYAGYCLSPTGIIFGPWISYADHEKTLSRTSFTQNTRWIRRFISSFVIAIFFLSLSTCWTNWLFGSSQPPHRNDRWRWLIAYGDALSYRSSHYFVSYISEASVAIGGQPTDSPVTALHHVEVPRSLVEVVTHWNIPMHYWLKTYVFKVARPYGHFVAILATYVASSLLHGMNFQLAAVLLSLGFYTFVEYKLRQKLADIFQICILAKRCKRDCDHIHKHSHPLVVAINLGLGMLTLFHLTYLGLMFDSTPSMEEKGYDMNHTLRKWGELGYASHWVALFTFVFYALLR